MQTRTWSRAHGILGCQKLTMLFQSFLNAPSKPDGDPQRRARSEGCACVQLHASRSVNRVLSSFCKYSSRSKEAGERGCNAQVT